ncbi:MAG: hypothetical protein CMK49_03760 [Prochlorococcus sp. SP3034]|nr:hypothetical protein [Prochlorococcus sp. SP3034]
MICSTNKNNIYLESIDINKLKQNIDHKKIINKDKNGKYLYQSREYKILNYKIEPTIYFTIKYEKDSIEINCEKIDLNIHSKLNYLIKIYINVKITKLSKDIKLQRVMELCLPNDQSFKIMPYAIKEFLLNKATSISSKRFDKRLTKKILELCN